MGHLTVIGRRFLIACAVSLAVPTVSAEDSIVPVGLPIWTKDVGSDITPTQKSRYDPSHFGIPDTIGGYSVFSILTEDNYACMRRGEKRIVLQSPQPTIEGGPRDFPQALIEQELQARHVKDSAQWELSVVGPGVTKEQVVRQFDQSLRFSEAYGCASRDLAMAPALGSPVSNCQSLGGGEFRCPNSGPGFAIIQNLGPVKYPNSVAQSVIFIAPSFRDGQNPWCQYSIAGACAKYHEASSDLLNNVMTDKNYFLQVGLYLTNRIRSDVSRTGVMPIGWSECGLPIPDPGNPFSPDGIGWVVFAGAQIVAGQESKADLRPRALCVPYVPGHHYYTTISYTSGVWWTCAADYQNTATYRCRQHPGATGGTHLKTSKGGTNVFFENHNKNIGRPWGLPPQLVAYGARIYTPSGAYPWPQQSKFTQHSCKDTRWPLANAIVGSSGLVQDSVHNGYAYFNTAYLPPWCDG